jgi:mRNA interferase MazF
MLLKPEEIWLVNFPFTERTSAKVRPAFIVVSSRSDVIILGIFSKVPTGNLNESSILIDSRHPNFTQTGLVKTSVVRVDKIATINGSLFQRKLGRLPVDLVVDVKESLRKTLNL